MKLLVVDDEIVQIRSIQRGLRNKGHNIIGAKSVDEAIEILNHTQVDLVLTDYLMPKRTGIELLKYIHTINPLLPVIMMTAYGSEMVIQESKGYQCKGFLKKPFTIKRLLQELGKIENGINTIKKFREGKK